MRVNHILSALALALPVYSISATAKMGCYSDLDSFKNQGPYTYQSPGYCQNLCTRNDFKIAALSRGDVCYCGNKMPSDNAKVADDECDIPCVGWPGENCGGKNAFLIIQTVENIEASASENASATVAHTAATAAGGIIVAPSTAVAATGIVTAASSATSKSANTGLSKSAASASASASSASPTTAFNAAGTVRVGSSLIGAVVAGMGLLL